jgi:hypothetical protein
MDSGFIPYAVCLILKRPVTLNASCWRARVTGTVTGWEIPRIVNSPLRIHFPAACGSTEAVVNTISGYFSASNTFSLSILCCIF